MRKHIVLLLVITSCLATGTPVGRVFAKDAATSDWSSLEKSYAEANVQLAEARLAQAQSQNQQVAGSVSDEAVAQLAAGVKLTKDRLQQLQSGSTSDPYGPQIAAAEDDLRGQEADYAEAIKANKLQAGVVSDTELQREQAEIAVAKAQLAALKVLSKQSPEVRMQWEICQLQDQVRALWARPLIED